MPKEEANIKAREHLKEHPLSTARELAQAVGCSVGLVSGLPAWKAVQGQRRKDRKPKPPDAVSLTDKTLAVVGEREKDEILKKLIKEQEQDAEPSPLEDDPSGKPPLKVRTRQRP